MDPTQYTGDFHRASEPSTGVLLLEFNRQVAILPRPRADRTSRAPVNAFHDAQVLWQEMHRIVDDVSNDPDVRCIVLSSALENAFTAGLDVTKSELSSGKTFLDPARRATSLRAHLLKFQAAITSLSRARQPVVCALFGSSVGLAIDIASACDIRVCASNVKFGIFEVNVGLAADIGTLQRFPKIIGNDSKARELAMIGRPFGAKEAEEIGFVSEVAQGGRQEVIELALQKAKMIASRSPIAVIGTKEVMNHSRDHSVDDGLQYVATWNMAMLQSEDTPKAMGSALKRTPVTFDPIAKAKL
ncbi:delta(3,5)-Delta(2,4)-dienoyl-CoA isomerase [Cryptococcus wingfieldii CBS 7118]|uniref:Delta(3,5)-Delta(2,4)-dienoyl-CoA isomerase n=1 Tax=Cryptococcus wingfieldii CBS 7118 TaxID=1295528 RepID=A0A1E3JWI0_9TREE|nr:delta(3,5)-Delta(2,4)-dienoyl-CoA isomerase [Cryptococcus wingfieldii CBS 7118]ODO05218.1 delta(3,5)-Delta(2,4)-dienoyl-CoA isomerase [Cryptococcus wingfieldii CBS 7118]